VRDQLVYFARLHGLTAAGAATAADRWIERLGLTERGDDRVETLSLGAVVVCCAVNGGH
jgi:ABC-2 type transport system ATP-binding protein